MAGLVSIDGRISPIAEAKIAADDRGLLFGDAVYEVIVADGKRLIDLDAHLDRLSQAASQCQIAMPWTHETLRFELEHILGLTGFARSALRLLITRGSSLNLSVEGKLDPHRYIYCQPAIPPNQKVYEQGLRLKIKRHPASPRGAQLKCPNYLAAIVAQTEAHKEGFDDILWTNQDGEITEGATANIFLISREGDLVEIATPPPAAGILMGITRARIIELLHRSQIPVTERSITLDELPRFDEAFMTSSVRGPLPVQLIDRHRLYSTRPQAVFHHILRLYRTWESQEGGGPLEEGSSLN